MKFIRNNYINLHQEDPRNSQKCPDFVCVCVGGGGGGGGGEGGRIE